MIREGVLQPAESGEFIARNAQHVTIHVEGLDKLCQEMLTSITNKLEIPDTGASIIHPQKDHCRAADWVFVADALNFCFWSYTGDQKWTIDGHSGYYALEAAMARAIKEGTDITNPEFYSKITEDQLGTIMRGDNEVKIPLFHERISVLHEVGKILIKKYNGTFVTCLQEANKSAVKLLEIIVNNFPCFRDEAVYKGKEVSLYKRAQILVADLWNFFDGTGWGEFEDIDKITMFADYRVPQVLVNYGVLSYSDELMGKLKKDANILTRSSGSDCQHFPMVGSVYWSREHPMAISWTKYTYNGYPQFIYNQVLAKDFKNTNIIQYKNNAIINCLFRFSDELLPSGSDEEVEIRGCSIHAVELLKKRIEKKLVGRNVEVPNSSLIDYYLWCYRRKYAEDMESVPFHKTLGIFY